MQLFRKYEREIFFEQESVTCLIRMVKRLEGPDLSYKGPDSPILFFTNNIVVEPFTSELGSSSELTIPYYYIACYYKDYFPHYMPFRYLAESTPIVTSAGNKEGLDLLREFELKRSFEGSIDLTNFFSARTSDYANFSYYIIAKIDTVMNKEVVLFFPQEVFCERLHPDDPPSRENCQYMIPTWTMGDGHVNAALEYMNSLCRFPTDDEIFNNVNRVINIYCRNYNVTNPVRICFQVPEEWLRNAFDSFIKG